MIESELISLLDRCGVEYEPPLAGVVSIVFRDNDGDQANGTVRLSNEGQVLQMCVSLMKASDSRYRSVLLQALLHLSFQYKLLKFGFDPSDGEIVIDIDICLSGGAALPASQMNRCIRLLKGVTASSARRIIKIKATGEDPGEEDGAEGQVAQIARLLAEREAARSGSGGESPSPSDSSSSRVSSTGPGKPKPEDPDEMLKSLLDELERDKK